uniref:GH10 domain-containing protein n=1 Tax=Ananas comosus var. bracteatus TaxID=296719 RepID=A0A6V7PY01_ANACO|nr:unnamed protein product [Ananas comosus var. bracteatus]
MCRSQPEPALYKGGILKNGKGTVQRHTIKRRQESTHQRLCCTISTRQQDTASHVSSVFLLSLFSCDVSPLICWVRIDGADSAIINARLTPDNSGTRCVGTVSAKSGCWSFLKGGFVLDSSSQSSVLFFQNADRNAMRISIASASLQPFSVEQWGMHQQQIVRTKRKRAVTIHVADSQGNRLTGASVLVQQISKDFPFGSAIANTILGNSVYQAWFVERFNAAVFEMSSSANHITVRGHNIFWENQEATPSWVRNLTGDDLRSAVKSRIESLMTRYKGEFAHWDVNNEMLHFNFYEQRLGPNASLDFFNTAQLADPLATLFMNEFNVIETCEDIFSSVDSYVSRLKDLKAGGALLEGSD